MTADRQRNRTTTDGTILDQRLFWLRSIDLDRKNLAAVRTGDLGLGD